MNHRRMLNSQTAPLGSHVGRGRPPAVPVHTCMTTALIPNSCRSHALVRLRTGLWSCDMRRLSAPAGTFRPASAAARPRPCTPITACMPRGQPPHVSQARAVHAAPRCVRQPRPPLLYTLPPQLPTITRTRSAHVVMAPACIPSHACMRAPGTARRHSPVPPLHFRSFRLS